MPSLSRVAHPEMSHALEANVALTYDGDGVRQELRVVKACILRHDAKRLQKTAHILGHVVNSNRRKKLFRLDAARLEACHNRRNRAVSGDLIVEFVKLHAAGNLGKVEAAREHDGHGKDDGHQKQAAQTRTAHILEHVLHQKPPLMRMA